MQFFSADVKVFVKNLKKKIGHENMKKVHLKVAHNRPPTFFYVLARLPKWTRSRNPLPPKAL